MLNFDFPQFYIEENFMEIDCQFSVNPTILVVSKTDQKISATVQETDSQTDKAYR